MKYNTKTQHYSTRTKGWNKTQLLDNYQSHNHNSNIREIQQKIDEILLKNSYITFWTHSPKQQMDNDQPNRENEI